MHKWRQSAGEIFIPDSVAQPAANWIITLTAKITAWEGAVWAAGEERKVVVWLEAANGVYPETDNMTDAMKSTLGKTTELGKTAAKEGVEVLEKSGDVGKDIIFGIRPEHI